MCQSHIFFQNNQFIYSSCLRKFFLALIFGESRRTSWFIYLHLPVRILLLAEITLYHFQWALFGAMCIKIFLCHGNFTVRAWNHSKRTNPQMWLWRTKKKKKKRQKRVNSMPLHLSQLRSYKHRKEEKIFKPPSVLVHQLIRSLRHHTLRPVVRSFSPSLYLGKPPMVIQIWKKKHTWRSAYGGEPSIQLYLFTICIFISHDCSII